MNKLEEAVQAVINHYVYGNNSSLITHLMETDSQFTSEHIVNGEWYEVESPYSNIEERVLFTRSELDDHIKRTGNSERIDYLNSLEPIDRTPTYWNEVDEWFAGKLIQRGAVVMMNDFGTWWGRDSGLLEDSEDLIAIAEELMDAK